LSPLEIQYRDYTAWIRELISADHFSQHPAYWTRRLTGTGKIVNFPFDRPRPDRMSHNGGTVKFSIDRSVTQGLNAISSERQASLFMTLCVVINLLLYRYTWETDIVIGTPIAGRVRKELEDQIGYYLNTLALRLTFNGYNSIDQILQKTKETVLEAYRYQLYPFDKVVEDVYKGRREQTAPFFDVGFTWQNIDESNHTDQEMPGIDICELERVGKISNHNFWFYGSEIDGKIDIRMRYNKDLYDEESVIRIGEDFIALCHLIVSSEPDIKIKQLVQSLIPLDKRVNNILDINLLNAALEDSF